MRTRSVVSAVAIAVLAASCGGQSKPTASRAFCRAADDYNTQVERAFKQRDQGTAEAGRQAKLLDAVARTAPEEIRADARTFASAMQRRADGDTSVVDDADVERAAENVNRFANQACNVYERDSGI